MAYKASFLGNGSQTDFAVSFPYLQRSHIGVFVDDIPVTFSFVNDGLVRLDVAPAAGTSVVVKRTTQKTPVITLQDGKPIPASSYMKLALQTLYVSEETDTSTDLALSVSAAAVAVGAAHAAMASVPSLYFESAPILLANGTMTYADVGVGDFIQTRQEGFFYKVASLVAVDHDVVTAGGVRLYVIPFDGALHLSQFGGGVSEAPATNTVAFQKAVDKAVALNIGVIQLPQGGLVQLSATQVVIPKLLTTRHLIIRGHGLSSGFHITSTSSTPTLYVGDPAVAGGGCGIEFRDLMFRGTSPTQGRAVRAVNANGLKFTKCGWYNLEIGVYSTASYMVIFDDPFMLNVGTYGFVSSTTAHGFRVFGGQHYNIGLAGTGCCYRFEGGITDNIVIRDGDYEFCRQVVSGGAAAGFTSLIIEGNYIEYCTVSMYGPGAPGAEAVSIRNNWIALAQGAASTGLDGIGTHSGDISNNRFYGDAVNKNDVRNISPHITFENNIFSGLAEDLSPKQVNITSFLNGYTVGSRQPGYRKQGNQLYLSGSVNFGTPGSPCFALPAGFWPRQTQKQAIIGTDATHTGWIIIDAANGNVVPNTTGGAEVCLDGVVVQL